MEIRPLIPSDLATLADIDATIESTHYLHVDKSGGGTALSIRVEERPLRAKQITSNPMDEDLAFTLKQIAGGAQEGLALVAEHDRQIVAMAVAQPDLSRGTMQLLDLRVDYDLRRQGLATAMVYQIMQATRDANLRAMAADVITSNFATNKLLAKAGFELSGVDVRRRTNHDMVKEAATLFWYAALD